jgi:hypothetical protein
VAVSKIKMVMVKSLGKDFAMLRDKKKDNKKKKPSPMMMAMKEKK